VGGGHIDALAAKGHALGYQQHSLASALGERTIGTDDAPPGQVGIVDGEEDGAGEAGRAGRNVAVGTDEAGGDRPYALQHFELAVAGDGIRFGVGQRAAGPKASMMRFWNSLSSSAEMK
jgi:hypothetical protein